MKQSYFRRGVAIDIDHLDLRMAFFHVLLLHSLHFLFNDLVAQRMLETRG